MENLVFCIHNFVVNLRTYSYYTTKTTYQMNHFLKTFFLFSSFCFSQNIQTIKISSEKVTFNKYVGFDEYGTNYFVDQNIFYKQEKIQTLNFKNIALGKITNIDLTNPLKIVLFYEDFNTVITLDNQLNETNNINFSGIETPIIAHATGIAAQNRLWIFDLQSQKIGLFDYLNNKYNPLSNLIQEPIKCYNTDFNYFYYTNAKNQLFSCDVFGKIIEIETFSDLENFMVSENEMIYKTGNNLFLFDLKTKKNNQINLNQKTFENFSYKNQILTIFTNQEITTFKIIKS